jgi:hypothetical protein
MTDQQLQLLRDVAAGKWNFRCASRSPRDLEAFQAVADDLLRLSALGLVGEYEVGVETETGRQYVNRVSIKGGLTELGRAELKGHL